MNKRVVSVSLLAVMAMSTLSGCGASENPKDIPLVPALSQKEVIDYYKQSLAYDTIASRTVKPNQVTYEMQDVTGDMKNVVAGEAGKIEALLARNNITLSDGMDPSIHQYIKYVLDDKQLTRDNIAHVREALGYYFVDIEYKLSAKTPGTFNENVKYLGINGAFKQDFSTKEVSVDSVFMQKANSDVQKYLAENPTYKTEVSPVAGVRAPLSDVVLYNRAAGISLKQTAMMPPLSMVYAYPAEGLSGYCLFPQGSFTLRDFNYSRSKMSGAATLRYVFKKDILDPSKIEFTNVYVTDYKLNNAPELDPGAVAPEFVKVEAEKLMERSDRAISNNDISALMSGKIYDDIGVAALYGNMRNFCYNQRHMSKVKSIVGREDHKYLIEFETLTQEGPKGSGTTGTYVQTGYMVVQQESTEFHITDYVITDFKMTKEPQINLESTIMKRLAALNLTGEVTDDAKAGINELMTKLYTSSTERQLQEMYECFNTDTNLLSSTHREYLNSQLRSWLIKHGTNSKSTYAGVVSQWIGGADNQVEFFTNELIDYEGKDNGLYMQNYYLVSSYDDKWVIDEMKVVESKDVSGAELESIREALQTGKSISVENADNEVKKQSEDNNDMNQVNQPVQEPNEDTQEPSEGLQEPSDTDTQEPVQEPNDTENQPNSQPEDVQEPSDTDGGWE